MLYSLSLFRPFAWARRVPGVYCRATVPIRICAREQSLQSLNDLIISIVFCSRILSAVHGTLATRRFEHHCVPSIPSVNSIGLFISILISCTLMHRSVYKGFFFSSYKYDTGRYCRLYMTLQLHEFGRLVAIIKLPSLNCHH